MLGGSIYLDGVDGGCEVLDSNTIQLTTVASPAGSCDAVVIDPSGVEGRRPDGYVFAHVPEIQSTFPEGGYAGGGTVVVLPGQNFEASAVVRIDGDAADAGRARGHDPRSISRPTRACPAALPDRGREPRRRDRDEPLQLRGDPDPEVVHVDPPARTAEWRNTIRIEGQNLGAATAVLFDADAATGEAGTPAASLLVIDSNTLEVVAPKHASGPQNLLVRNDATGQAVLLTNAYRFQDASGGGGGGCYVQPYSPPAGPREMLAGAWWLCALLVFALRAQIRRPAATLARMPSNVIAFDIEVAGFAWEEVDEITRAVPRQPRTRRGEARRARAHRALSRPGQGDRDRHVARRRRARPRHDPARVRTTRRRSGRRCPPRRSSAAARNSCSRASGSSSDLRNAAFRAW
ncbi:MAG: hypothetical protein IPJ19_18960 [Planctomycetes bacterium]|nr:hypothetical protein [Planctomycetota bacterium]